MHGQSCSLGGITKLPSGMSGSVVGMLSSDLSADSCVLTAELLFIAAAGLSARHAEKIIGEKLHSPYIIMYHDHNKGRISWHNDTKRIMVMSQWKC